MIFALATDEATLLVFPDAQGVLAYCEGIDVEDGAWRFWAHDGSPLQADFVVPNQRGRFAVTSGAYRLVAADAGDDLPAAMDGIRGIEPNPFFASLAAVRAYFAGKA